MLTNAQKQTLAAALRAENDAGVVAAMAIRDDVALTAWCNSASLIDSWKYNAQRRDLFNAINVTNFDNLSQGKRDAWRLMMDNSPIDFTVQAMRKAVADTWGANADSVLAGCVEKATHAEAYIGGASRTQGGVTAITRAFAGTVSLQELSELLNA